MRYKLDKKPSGQLPSDYSKPGRRSPTAPSVFGQRRKFVKVRLSTWTELGCPKSIALQDLDYHWYSVPVLVINDRKPKKRKTLHQFRVQEVLTADGRFGVKTRFVSKFTPRPGGGEPLPVPRPAGPHDTGDALACRCCACLPGLSADERYGRHGTIVTAP